MCVCVCGGGGGIIAGFGWGEPLPMGWDNSRVWLGRTPAYELGYTVSLHLQVQKVIAATKQSIIHRNLDSSTRHDIKVQIAENERTAKQFSSENVLELLFNNVFYMSEGCSSDEACKCTEGP